MREGNLGRVQVVLLRGLLIMALGMLAGCVNQGELVRCKVDRQNLQRDLEQARRQVADRDAQIAKLERRTEELVAANPDHPTDLFAPVKLEIASLSGGADYDGKPGDDGVTVYLRPLDADGDVVKVPGRIVIKLIDNTSSGTAQQIGPAYVFDGAKTLRESWNGKLLTNHYTLRCPLPPGAKLPASRKVLVSAEFTDYLTRNTVTVVKEVTVSFPAP